LPVSIEHGRSDAVAAVVGYRRIEMRELTDDLSPEEKKVLTDVAQEGVHVVHVPADGQSPGFSSTIGLWYQFDHPEIIVFGLPEGVADQLLNAITDAADDGKRFGQGQRQKDLMVGYEVMFVDVLEEHLEKFFGTALWAYAGGDFRCLQLIWPDKESRWPWQDGTREGFRASQPILGRYQA
jgi:hypothetical protein